MNIRHFISKTPLLFSVLFYAGIAFSAFLLLTLQFGNTSLTLTYSIVGLTFFLGVIALTTTSHAAKQVVVYLEKKKEIVTQQELANHASIHSQLNVPALLRVTESKQNGAQLFLNELCKQVQAGQGAIYEIKDQSLRLQYGYALNISENDHERSYTLGEGLIGRVASEASPLYIDKLPENYITIFSGLGSASPGHLMIVPIQTETEIKGVLEIATFTPLNSVTRADMLKAGETLAKLI